MNLKHLEDEKRFLESCANEERCKLESGQGSLSVLDHYSKQIQEIESKIFHLLLELG